MKTLTIVLEAPEGSLAKISGLLGDAGINIVDIDAGEVENTGIMHVTVDSDEFENAHNLLREAGYQVMPQEVLLVRVEDKPGELAKLAVRLTEAKVNVRSMRIVKRENGTSLCAIVPEPFDIARALLAEYIVKAV